MTNTSAVSSTLTISTTARPVPAAEIRRFGSWYAALLPIAGLSFLGIGIGASRRRWVITILGVLLLSSAGWLAGCSSSSGNATPPTGTPAGTYAVTITGTSGSAAHQTRATLVVE